MNAYTASVTFEFDLQAPETWKGQVAGDRPSTAARRALEAAQAARPGSRPRSIVGELRHDIGAAFDLAIDAPLRRLVGNCEQAAPGGNGMSFGTDGRTDGRTVAGVSTPDPRAVLDDLADRRRRCTEAIVTLAAFYLLDAAPWLDGAPAASPRPAPAKAPQAVTRGRPRKVNSVKARPTKALSGTRDVILAALREHGEPMSPGDLAKACKLDVPVLRYQLKALLSAGEVTATGQTTNRRVSLA